MDIRVFTSPILRKQQTEDELRALVVDFKLYKSSGVLPNSFGLDVPYHRPSAVQFAELKHIHMNLGAGWPLRIVQQKRTSNVALVYCPGWHSKDNYLLIALLANAHEQARKITFMLELCEDAEKFRAKY